MILRPMFRIRRSIRLRHSYDVVISCKAAIAAAQYSRLRDRFAQISARDDCLYGNRRNSYIKHQT